MSILTVLELKAVAGKADEALAVLTKHLGDTRARPGCEMVTVHQDQSDPTSILLIERWASRADDEAYRAWRAGDGAITEMAGLLVGANVRYFDDVDA
jgi:quinol monooxygenase YgiN